jgi:hypothetical protein
MLRVGQSLRTCMFWCTQHFWQRDFELPRRRAKTILRVYSPLLYMYLRV